MFSFNKLKVAVAFSDLLHESLNKPKVLSNILRSISTNREINRKYSASEV
ncbi:5117_t:CDS:2 [Cetraspora pellucida]|uniref:5117_t:CDS:1 n=1 Tax=Cetraspora pellucida TaxID=1433469 RepID=A0A9N9BYR9_9GLOM|nr:5117_t:CDS:2 [Cetraspora pellucida]